MIPYSTQQGGTLISIRSDADPEDNVSVSYGVLLPGVLRMYSVLVKYSVLRHRECPTHEQLHLQQALRRL